MWNELAFGAVGVIILADTRRLADCFPAVDYFELRRVPFVLAVNNFDGAPRFHSEAVRVALDLDPEVPVISCDARERTSCRDALVVLVDYARRLLEAAPATQGPAGR
jgi:signal recognition particle receptor subunit beta